VALDMIQRTKFIGNLLVVYANTATIELRQKRRAY